MAARYVTWEGFEADKLACIWLIKRHIDHDATFFFIAPGTKPASGIPFDMPEGELKRRPDRSSFEVMVSHYRLMDPRLEKMALYIHDIEINTWEKKKYRQSRDIQRFISALTAERKKPQAVIDAAIAFFDRLYSGR